MAAPNITQCDIQGAIGKYHLKNDLPSKVNITWSGSYRGRMTPHAAEDVSILTDGTIINYGNSGAEPTAHSPQQQQPLSSA